MIDTSWPEQQNDKNIPDTVDNALQELTVITTWWQLDLTPKPFNTALHEDRSTLVKMSSDSAYCSQAFQWPISTISRLPSCQFLHSWGRTSDNTDRQTDGVQLVIWPHRLYV